MSPRNARAVSTAVVGGLAALVFFRMGLFFWVGVVAWVALAEGGDEPGSTGKVLVGMLFGAVVAWAAIVVSLLIPVPPEGWMWVPRLAAVVALSLYILDLSTGAAPLSRRSACLLGYAALFGVAAVTAAEAAALQRFTGTHLTNPLLATTIPIMGGVLFGHAAKSMEKALA